MARTRKPSRITRTQPKGADRQQPQDRGSRPRHYRKAWQRDPAALDGFVPAYTNVSLAPPELVERAVKEKLGWVQRFLNEGCPRGKLLEYAERYAESQGWAADRVPPYTTLREWVKRYQHAGLVGLIDRVRRDSGLSRTVVGPAAQAVSLGMALGKGPAQTLSLISRISHGELPKYDAVRRELARLRLQDPHLAAMAAHGPTYFRDLGDLTLRFPDVAGGVRLSIDTTVADIWVKVPRPGGGWEAHRPVLTIIEDVGSRLLVTFNLSLYRVDSGICLGLLGRAIDQRRNYPGLHSVGVPWEFTHDKGSEHQGAFREALKRLGIAIAPRRDNNPRGGTHVERLIGTITTAVLQGERGYSACEREFDAYAPAEWDTKRNLKQLKYEPYRRDVLPEHLLTLREVEELILAWAISYNARPHTSLPENSPEIQALLRDRASRAGLADPSRDSDSTPTGSDQEVA